MKYKRFYEATSVLLLAVLPQVYSKLPPLEEITNKKDFEKTLRTRNNVLIIFKKSAKDVPSALTQTLEQVADQSRGAALVAQIDCSSSDGKKICKKEKADPASYVLKHYNKGEFNKDYDRPESIKSFLSFLKDPTSEAPWDDDPTAKDVLHIEDSAQLRKFLTTERKPSLIMFYAPWCGHCKRMKPEYAAAATELKREAVLVAMDVNRPQNADIRQAFNITGFPTLYYFRDGRFQYPFGGDRTKSGIVQWMRNPQPPKREEGAAEPFDQPHEEL
ncbi:protein disulfide-isomerase A5-like [Paramacrobiotus metropolitanus]|uniref:protein disulfide-isomerase A5-like n=1 Tax=Paramacrobiotus metropolitanus TaxID=2943436 RepID=UPI002445E4AF|nr:protein disulfide-isomerase A5-like [Paramacrobiotus metropolitanus]